MRKIVVLPHPEGPIRHTKLCGWIESVRFRTASTRPPVGVAVDLAQDVDFKRW